MDLAISAKLGEGFCFSVMGLCSGVFALCLEMVNELTIGVAVVGFGHPILWVTRKRTPGVSPSTLTVALFPHGFRCLRLRASR